MESILALAESYIYIPIVLVVLATAYFFFSGSSSTPATSTTASTTSVTKKKKEEEDLSKPLLKILFGSQTGTAEEFAYKLALEAKQHMFRTEVIDLEDYETDDLENESFVVFVVSTYGEGEPTDNARTFHDWICDETLDDTHLSGVKYVVFGLGNKTYEHYNYMGKYVEKHMNRLGATNLFKLGLGDDDENLEDDFALWKKKLWPVLCKQFGIDISVLKNQPAIRRFKVDYHTDPEHRAYKKAMDTKSKHLHLRHTSRSYDLKHPYQATITVNRELHTEKSDRSCRHIEVDVGKAIKYVTGDHLGVYPENNPKIVEAFAKRLKVDTNAAFSMRTNDHQSRLVLGPTTVGQALSQFCDLSWFPRKSLLKVFSQYAKDEGEKKRLEELSDDESAQPYNKFVKDAHRSTYQILEEFPSVEIPFDHFLEACARLTARMYSISSSNKVNPTSVHLTAVLVKEKTPTGREHLGVATSWLTQLPKSAPVFLEKSTFRLPKDLDTPIIMVGPGTGLAPFRGFIQELYEEKKTQEENGKKVRQSILFFGCRRRDEDYIYQDELEQALKDGVLTELSLAFSREQSEKVYVQHKLQEQASRIWKLLDSEGAYFYICGDAKYMAKDVRQCLLDAAVKFGGKSKDEAEKYLQKMADDHRYHTDVWF